MTSAFCNLAAIIVILPAAVASSAAGTDPLPASERSLFGFDTADSVKLWTPVNDTVMGGVSSGACRWLPEGVLEFSGEVSLENNGGFASLRADMGSIDLSAYDELVLRVRGDGKRYALSVQTDFRIIAGAYYFSFETKPEVWREVRVPLRLLEARSFGRPLRTAPPLNASDIRALGFMISDKQTGAFRLQVDWVRAEQSVEAKSRREGQNTQAGATTVTALLRKAIERGAPVFNAGQPGACASIYQTVSECVIKLAPRDLPVKTVEALQAGVALAGQTDDPVERAWCLRRALDAALATLEQDSPDR